MNFCPRQSRSIFGGMGVMLMVVLMMSLQGCEGAQYNASWGSLNARPIPDWWLHDKVGIFIHMGVFSVPAYRCDQEPSPGLLSAEWYWDYLDGAQYSCIIDYHHATFGPNFQYQDFVFDYRLSLFNATFWAQLFKASGAKWVVLTSKHHEGFCNWPSANAWNWNSATMGPHRDVVGELATAVRAAGLRFGVYHSLFEWFNPLFLQDQANNFTTQVYVKEVVTPMLHDLVNRYQPAVIWSDGDWSASPDYWNSTNFLAWLYNESPVRQEVVTNDRWGLGTNCQDGGFWTCQDRYNPGVLVNHAWENAFTIQSATWGLAQNSPLDQYLSAQEVLYQVVSTVAFGGNCLINVGPSAQGVIDPIFQERLLQLGAFLAVNGPAIYGSLPWSVAQNQTDANLQIFYTTTPSSSSSSSSASTINAILLNPNLFTNPTIKLLAPIATQQSSVSMLTATGPLPLSWSPLTSLGSPGIVISLPVMQLDPYACTFVLEQFANSS